LQSRGGSFRDAALPGRGGDPGAGLTYKAYLDILLESVRLKSCTVWIPIMAVAIVGPRSLVSRLRTSGNSRGRTNFARDGRQRLLQEWRRVGKDDTAAFRLLKGSTKPLLNLVTVRNF